MQRISSSESITGTGLIAPTCTAYLERLQAFLVTYDRDWEAMMLLRKALPYSQGEVSLHRTVLFSEATTIGDRLLAVAMDFSTILVETSKFEERGLLVDTPALIRRLQHVHDEVMEHLSRFTTLLNEQLPRACEPGTPYYELAHPMFQRCVEGWQTVAHTIEHLMENLRTLNPSQADLPLMVKGSLGQQVDTEIEVLRRQLDAALSDF